MKKKIILCCTVFFIYVAVFLIDHTTGIFQFLSTIEWLISMPKDAVVYILLPLITLVISLYFSRVEKAKSDFGSKVYSRMLEKRIIKFSLSDVYIIAILYSVIAVFTIIYSQLIFTVLFIGVSAVVALITSVAFYYINRNIISLYLPSLEKQYVESIGCENVDFKNDVILSLVENCVLNEKVEELNSILDTFQSIIKKSLEKYKCELNGNEYQRNNIIEVYKVMLEITVISSRNDLINSSIEKEYYVTKCLNDSYRRDCITIYEMMVEQIITRFYFTKSYRKDYIDQLFAAHVIIGSANYIIRKTDSKTWIEKSIKNVTELIFAKVFSASRIESEVILVSLHNILLENNFSKTATDDDHKRLISAYFSYVGNYVDSSKEISIYYPVTKQILNGLKKDMNENILKMFVAEFRSFLLITNIRNSQIIHDNLMIVIKLKEDFQSMLGNDYVEKLLYDLLIDKSSMIANAQANAMYIDLFLDILSNDNNLDEYHEAFESLFDNLSRKDEVLCNYVFSFYIEKLIENIEDSVELEKYMKVVSKYMRDGSREFKDSLFYASSNTFFSRYKDYLVNNPKTNHEYKKIIMLIKDMLLETIDVNNNDRYIFIIKRLKNLVEETSKFGTKGVVRYVFEILYSVSKYSLERYYIDIVKSSSNELSWYVKNQFSDNYTEYLEDGIQSIADLFNISIHLDPKSKIVPSFIGTAFILLGSIDYDRKDRPSRNSKLINKALKEIYSQEVYDILQISYRLRLSGKTILGSEFNDEAITNYYNSFKKHVANK